MDEQIKDNQETTEITEQQLTTLSDEELNNLVNPEVEVVEEVKEEETQEEPTEATEESGETSAEEKVEEEPVKESADSEEVKTEEVDPVELKTKLEKLDKRNRDQSEFINRLTNELGDLRKLAKDTNKDILQEDELADLWQSNPAKATEVTIEQQKLKESQDKSVQAILDLQTRNNRQQWIEDKVEDFDSILDDVVNLAVEDKLIDETVAADIKRDPYVVNEVDLYNLARRVKLNNELTKLKETIESKDKEIEKLKTQPEQVADKIRKAANEVEVSSQPGNSVKRKNINDLTEADLAVMSDEQLAELSKK